MNLTPWNGPNRRKSLIVLGAGASHGADFVADGFHARPPLDLGFFSELQRLQARKNIDNLLKFVRDEFGSSLDLSMEEFFSQVDYTDRFHRDLSVDRGPKIKTYERALGWFYEVLPLLFKHAIGNRTCRYHNHLARRLFAEDVIISFNYDCLIDAALREQSNRRWEPEKGYGFSVASGGQFWKKHSGRGKSPESSIALLKPHGSLNWKISGANISLEQSPYEIATATGRIVPPTWFKDLKEHPYDKIWKQARREIRSCRALVVIGYSVPETDLFSRALFKVEAGSKIHREKLDFVVLANPDPKARRRFVDLVRGGIEPSTRILEFNTFKELVQSLGLAEASEESSERTTQRQTRRATGSRTPKRSR